MLERLIFDAVFGLLACVHAGSGEKTYGYVVWREGVGGWVGSS